MNKTDETVVNLTALTPNGWSMEIRPQLGGGDGPFTLTGLHEALQWIDVDVITDEGVCSLTLQAAFDIPNAGVKRRRSSQTLPEDHVQLNDRGDGWTGSIASENVIVIAAINPEEVQP